MPTCSTLPVCGPGHILYPASQYVRGNGLDQAGRGPARGRDHGDRRGRPDRAAAPGRRQRPDPRRGRGDGTVSAATAVALETGLPLLVIPAGTFNHFAADLGVESARDVLAALRDRRSRPGIPRPGGRPAVRQHLEHRRVRGSGERQAAARGCAGQAAGGGPDGIIVTVSGEVDIGTEGLQRQGLLRARRQAPARRVRRLVHGLRRPAGAPHDPAER
jgi:hypothetical protein